LSNALEIRDLAVEIRGKVVLDNVNLVAEKGSVVAIEGPTGSGKTTLLKVVTGLFQTLYKGKKVRGYVRVFGLEPVEALYKGLVAYIPQDPYNFFLGSTPAEEAYLLGIDLSKLVECSKVNPWVSFAKLSDGQLWRVLLCLSLLCGAKVLALDEPTSHLDPWSSGEVLNLIKDYAEKSGAIVLVADHRPEVIERYSDIILRLGYTEPFCKLGVEIPSGNGEVLAALKGLGMLRT